MTIAYFIFLTFQMLLLHDTYSINFIQQHKSFQRCNIASCEDNINSTNNKRGLTHNNFFLNMFKCFMYMYISLLNMAYSQSTMWVLCVYYSSNNLKKLEQSSFNEKIQTNLQSLPLSVLPLGSAWVHPSPLSASLRVHSSSPLSASSLSIPLSLTLLCQKRNYCAATI